MANAGLPRHGPGQHARTDPQDDRGGSTLSAIIHYTSSQGVTPRHGSEEFVAAMRRLKTRSGMSYRDLERRAAQHGDVLPRSTLQTALARDELPRWEVVAAFVRACGCDQHETSAWLAAYRRSVEPVPATNPVRSRRALAALVATVATVIMVAVAGMRSR